eukprot:gb/GECH01001375.1/.p1 GENE.gb/GECH01001375.1/~~gb/GECH01001375.1/.p1  ORF type:complete len:331 (+),score=82.98 gb/GECH01001375.1/:1-993(+)
MKSLTFNKMLTLNLILVLLLSSQITLLKAQENQQNVLNLYDNDQTGDGTYYSYTSGGACTPEPQAAIYEGMTAVAINDPQFYGSATCGMCVEVRGTGGGSGNDPISQEPFLAVVHDLCPECSVGDLDLIGGKDGRWDIEWRAVPCPMGSDSVVVTYILQGSNPYYIKIQPRNMQIPLNRMWLRNPSENTWMEMERTSDNFFELSPGFEVETPFRVRMESLLGETLEDQVPQIAENKNEIEGLDRVQFSRVQEESSDSGDSPGSGGSGDDGGIVIVSSSEATDRSDTSTGSSDDNTSENSASNSIHGSWIMVITMMITIMMMSIFIVGISI